MFTLNLLRHPRTIPLFTALALGACELPAKVGDLPDSETGSDTSTGDEPKATSSDTGDDPSDTGDDPSDTNPSDTNPSGDDPSDTNPSGEPPACADFSEEQCVNDPGCQPMYGEQLISEGCMVVPDVFVTCVEFGLECDQAESIVCDDAGSYRIPVTCELPGFEPCTPMCGDNECEGLDERSCVANALCKPVHGNPHVPNGEEMCVDDNITAYLGCLLDTGACPPNVPTVCPVGAPDEAYDVPSGCIPLQFVACGAGGTPTCE